MGIHIGGNTVSGLTAQTPGTIYTYGWQVCFENQNTNILGSLSVDNNISTTNGNFAGTLTTSNLTLTGIALGFNGNSVGLGYVNNTSDLAKPTSLQLNNHYIQKQI